MTAEEEQRTSPAPALTDSMIEHQAGLVFDEAMRTMLSYNISTADALAALRKVASEGNGWGW